jgi:hypothetical protein
MRAPIALIIFNRPENTQRVFEAIRQAKPSKLLVIADGPRATRLDDREKCAATRAVIDQVDWDCQVLRNFATDNLGCGERVTSGISWVFEQVEEAIILEDDCLPDPSFFPFCDELLERYRQDERIAHISGNNFWSHKYPLEESYLFSHYTLSWGWATWRRAWQHHDLHLKRWPEIQEKNLLQDILHDPHAVSNWTSILQNLLDRDVDTWDYQWTLACWLQNGLSILPNVNLVSNIGFGADATHTFSADNFGKDCASFSIPSMTMHFPLKHPELVVRHAAIDRFIQDNLYDYRPSLPKRLQQKVSRLLKQRVA